MKCSLFGFFPLQPSKNVTPFFRLYWNRWRAGIDPWMVCRTPVQTTGSDIRWLGVQPLNHPFPAVSLRASYWNFCVSTAVEWGYNSAYITDLLNELILTKHLQLRAFLILLPSFTEHCTCHHHRQLNKMVSSAHFYKILFCVCIIAIPTGGTRSGDVFKSC